MFLTQLNIQIQCVHVKHTATQLIKDNFLECWLFPEVADKESQVFKKGLDVSEVFYIKIALC